MDISDLYLLIYNTGNYADIYTTKNKKLMVKISNYTYDELKNFDNIVDYTGSCDLELLCETFFSSIISDRVVGAKICRYDGEFALISNMDGESLNNYKFSKSHSNEQIIWFIYQIISALNNIHRRHLVHGDVALRNIIFDVPDHISYVDEIITNGDDTRLDRIKFIDFARTNFEDLANVNKDYEGLILSLEQLMHKIYFFDDFENINRVLEKIEERVPLNIILLDPLFYHLNMRYSNVIKSVKLKCDPFITVLDWDHQELLFGWFDDVSQTIINPYKKYFLIISKEIFESFAAANGIPHHTLIQLYGVTAIFITLKILIIGLHDPGKTVIEYMKYICDNLYTLEDIRAAEIEILKEIDFSRIINNVIYRLFDHCE